MESTVSVAKGVFVFKNGFKSSIRNTKRQKKHIRLDTNSIYSNTLWYKTYASFWTSVEKEIQMMNDEMFSNVLSNLVEFVKHSYDTTVTEVPAAALLTGINMPDHAVQFSTLRKKLKAEVTPHVAYLPSHDCPNAASLVESMVYQLVNGESIDQDDSDLEEEQVKIKKSNCSFALLEEWYKHLNQSSSPKKKHSVSRNQPRNLIVLIIPDFEGFGSSVLQVLIEASGHYMNTLPLVLIFGIATSFSILYKTISYCVLSKINISVFDSQPSTAYLNNVLENVFFKKSCPFHLSGNVFNLLTDVFLFYDLSVTGFISNFKYAVLEHFSYGNAMSLCCTSVKEIDDLLKKFTHDDCENVRKLMSFRTLVENERHANRIKLLIDDRYFKSRLKEDLIKIWDYLDDFHIFLNCLHVLVSDLPKAPLGKQIRELYAVATSENIVKTKEFSQSFQLLSFQSKDELNVKVSKVGDILTRVVMDSKEERGELKHILKKLNVYINNLNFSENNDIVTDTAETVTSDTMDRRHLKEKLFAMAQTKPLTRYEEIRKELLQFLSEIFEKYLQEPKNYYFHEIFFFSDMSIQNHIIGSNRAAIHNALNDPHYYWQCDCCEIPNEDSILRSMPDICIAYKLHLECGRLINLYDWLQAFLCIVDTVEFEDETKRIVKPELQARFTQAVAELEFLGFIKSCRIKVDHVSRLTWGG